MTSFKRPKASRGITESTESEESENICASDSAEDVALAPSKPKKPVKLKASDMTKEGMDLFFAMDPKALIAYLAKGVSEARTPEGLAKAAQAVADAGLDPMVVAFFGTKRTAEKLGVNPEVVKRLRKAKATLGPDGLLHVRRHLDLMRLPEGTSIPALGSVRGNLNAQGTRNLSLPLMASVGWALNAESTENLSLPLLATIGWTLMAGATRNLSMPSIKTVKGRHVSRVEPNGMVFYA